MIGTLLQYDEIAEAGLIVQDHLRQDRSLSVIVARKLALWTSDVSTLLNNRIRDFYAANGADFAEGNPKLLHLEDHEKPGSDAAIGVAVVFTSLVMASRLGPQKAPADDWKFYSDLHRSSHTDDTRSIASDMISWAAIAIARLVNAGRFDLSRSAPEFPAFNAGYREVVALTVPTWYPNPQKVGGIVNGDAKFQRFWDGSDWTDRVRIREGGRWTEHSVPINSPPTN